MCDQTEISYLDGDVVWVKLGPCWWPGQVTGVDNLPDDIQQKMKKKPLIAAVKFFQEDTYEFVKNIQQIYKYNCRQKDEFIKKGLDKYRSIKSKDGSNYMNKFPGDVEMAEKLTNGDPDILTSSKFCPEQKPDISSLFGEKKLPKRKKDKEDASRRSVSRENVKKITHPRFTGRKSDHEVRIRQQTSSSLLSTPRPNDSSANLYSCPLCNFTSTRVNVIICHNKSHRSGGFETPPARRTSPLKIRSAGAEPQKRKYVRKNKSLSAKLKIERDPETPKRKYTKQSNEKSAKKKKIDPDVNEKLLKEKLLADWSDESDDDMELDLDATNPENLPSSPILLKKSPEDSDNESDGRSSDILKESEKFLKETEKFSSALKSPNNRLDIDSEKEMSRSPLSKKPKKFSEKIKTPSPEKDDKKSKLSCFDFEEEESEPALLPVRKNPRVFGEKNTSLKKEIIKEFTKNQARENEKVAEEKSPIKQKPEIKEPETINNLKDSDDDKLNDEINQTVNEATELIAKIAEETETSNLTKSKSEATETELEIVEILEVERDKEEDENSGENSESKKSDDESVPKSDKPPKEEEEEKMEESGCSKVDDEDLGRVTMETENDVLDFPQKTGTSSGLGDIAINQLSDIIGATSSESSQDNSQTPEVPEKPVRRRGRPRKSILPVNVSGNGDALIKIDETQPPGTPDSQDFDRKTSESEGERSYTGRRRKPNKKYLESEIYSSSPGRRTPRTDDSQSETEEKPLKDQKRGRRGRKPSGINKNIRKSLEEYEFSDQTLDSAEESVIAAVAMSPGSKSPVKIQDVAKKREIMSPVNITDLLTSSDVEIRENQTPERSFEAEMIKDIIPNDQIVNSDEEIRKAEKLPPKKSQIKKFEQSKLDSIDSVREEEEEMKEVPEDFHTDLNKILDENEKQESPENVMKVIHIEKAEIIEPTETIIKETIENIVVKEISTIEKSLEENIEILCEEKDMKTDLQVQDTEVIEEHIETIEQISIVPEKIPEPEEQEEINKIEAVAEKEEAVEKVEKTTSEEVVIPSITPIATEEVPELVPVLTKSPEIPTSPKKILGSPKKIVGVISKSVESLQKTQEGSIPVKKREKPRIIENVALKEPMQILKSKLLEKQPPKSHKHKLDSEMPKKFKVMGIPPAKMMKIDSPTVKTKTSSKLGSGQMSIPQKLHVLKADEAINEAKNDQILGNTSGIISLPSGGSQNLQEIELDINSIPFVLSEDLNPDSIEQMPVLLSGIISSASPSASTTITFTQPTQSLPQQIELGSKIGEIIPEASPVKKKTASPAILKNKGKAKPTITSIKTLNPPMTGGVKGLKFQNTQGKTLPVMSQKSSPGKYVIVHQTPGGQQVRYTVQGKPGMNQKVAIPQGKSSCNPQIVQKGNKVVIFTSPQGKMVPLGTQKPTMNKVQKVMSPQGQIYSQKISPKNQMIVPKTDTNSPTTSKLSPGQKLISSHQSIVGSKMYTSAKMFMPEMGKNQGILTKNAVFTSIGSSGLTQRTIMGSKTLMTKDGQILGTISSQPGHKTILAPISQSSLIGKNLLSSQGIISSKGTVLTPITGQQVKAIAAKTPGKGMKMQGQSQKVQIPMLQKCQKVAIPSNANAGMRVAGSTRSPGGTVMYQNAGQSPQSTLTKISTQGKKIIRQNIISQPGKSPIATATSPLMANRGKLTTSMMQKVAVPKSRSTKIQPKYVVQKMQDSISNMSPIKTTVSSTVTKLPASPKTMTSTSPMLKSSPKSSGTPKMIQKHVLSPLVASSTSTTISTPPQIPEKTEIKPEEITETIPRLTTNIVEQKAEVLIEGTKADDQKVPHQPQIMALPTESADGTQTYVLVTIDEQGTIHPLDNNALMSLEGTTTNPDGTRTLYIDPGSLGDAGGLDNIVLQFDGAAGSNLTSGTSETVQPTETESFTSSNQDILAAALANTDFQGEIGLPETPAVSVIAPGITQTSLINQTILQSTIIPTSDPISSPSVLETSLTLNQPIMSAVEVPSNITIASQMTSTSVPTSLELPISITPGLSYLSVPEEQIQLPGNSMPDIGELMESPQVETESTSEFLVLSNSGENTGVTTVEPTSSVSYSVSISENIAVVDVTQAQTTPSMPIIDDSIVETDEFPVKTDENTEFTTEVGVNPAEFNEIPVSEMLIPKTHVTEEEQEKIQEQPETTTQQIRDMPIVIETEEILQKNDAEVLNSDVVDSCMSAENSCLPAESSEEVQSSEKIIIQSSENIESSQLSTEVNLTSQEAETSQKNEVFQEIPDQAEAMEVDEAPYNTGEEIKQSAESSCTPEVEQMETNEIGCGQDVVDAQPEQEIPTQSFEQFKIAENDESPSQSAEKSSDSREPSQSEADESMEVSVEPPSQSFEDSTGQEASQSFQESSEVERSDQSNSQDDPSFPTQSYEVEKIENIAESLETDGELSQEGNIPSQSNDIGADGIGTSTFSNIGNDDETASSSYVPETPENQERDQDQESAISTSSYEIPPCDEINIASSSLIPDTSGTEHASIHDNGVPEIPTSSYNLNPDSSSTHVDSVPSSSFEDQVVIEQNVSTSYEVPISMPSVEENSSGNFVSESGDQRNEPSSYYARNPEEVTSEASQSYFVPEGPSPSYTSQNVSPSYYDTPQETEASQSFYSTQEIERTEQSSSINVEASQSFYQENSDELRLRQQGEATPTYTERYPVDYTLENSPIERHDLVESSVPASRPTER